MGITPPLTLTPPQVAPHNHTNMYKIAVVVLMACVAINAAPQYLIGAPYGAAAYGHLGYAAHAALPYAAAPVVPAPVVPAPVATVHHAPVKVLETAPKVEVVAEPVEQHGYVISY